MPDRVAVITPSRADRGAMLAECVASVTAQTQPPALHLVSVDHERAGCVATLNCLFRAAEAADVEWIALLADDDLAYPQHLETLLRDAADFDIVYTYCDVTGRDWNPNAPFDVARLRKESYIPSTSLIRASLVEELGGWREDAANGFEDWDFWLRALDIAARFECVPEVTWLYRFHGGNESHGGGT